MLSFLAVTVLAVGTAAVAMMVVVCSIPPMAASVVVAIGAVDIVNTGLLVVASFNPLSTLHHTRLIQSVYGVQRNPQL